VASSHEHVHEGEGAGSTNGRLAARSRAGRGMAGPLVVLQRGIVRDRAHGHGGMPNSELPLAIGRCGDAEVLADGASGGGSGVGGEGVEEEGLERRLTSVAHRHVRWQKRIETSNWSVSGRIHD